jgi:hypothetical protein
MLLQRGFLPSSSVSTKLFDLQPNAYQAVLLYDPHYLANHTPQQEVYKLAEAEAGVVEGCHACQEEDYNKGNLYYNSESSGELRGQALSRFKCRQSEIKFNKLFIIAQNCVL